MTRRAWLLGMGILLFCVASLSLFLFLPVGAQESEDLYLPAVFGDSPLTGPIDQGSLSTEDLVVRSLVGDTTHRWGIYLLESDTITVSVAPGSSADITLSLLGSEGLVYEQNLSPPGEVETIADLGIADSGEYDLLVQTVDGRPTDYALMLLDQDSYNFILRGALQDNDSRDDSLPAEVDHFWFFNALSGETVSFTISPKSGGDPYVELYGPSGGLLMTLDNSGEGEPESLQNYPLLADGLYGIRVGEFDFTAMDYQIKIAKP